MVPKGQSASCQKEMPAGEEGQMSSIETGQIAAVETGLMSAVEVGLLTRDRFVKTIRMNRQAHKVFLSMLSQ